MTDELIKPETGSSGSIGGTGTITAVAQEKPWYQSKKLAAATLAYVFVMLTEGLGLKISEQAWRLVENVTMTLIGGQSIVDVVGPALKGFIAGKAGPAAPK